ncbi:MAG: hypothetical protein ACK4YM_00330 [Novosphingobium sp.]
MAQPPACAPWPRGSDVADLVIEAGIAPAWVRWRVSEQISADALAARPKLLMPPQAVTDAYWALCSQPKAALTFKPESRPDGEQW